MNVVLIGMKHCGKSTLGERLAARWGCAFHDVDVLIERMHACQAGRPRTVREIFRECGEDEFHRLESLVVCDLYMQLQGQAEPCVVALGGRTVTNRRVVALLDGLGTMVYLRADPVLVLGRILAHGVPPFLEGDESGEEFLRIWGERIPEYERLADIIVAVGERDIDAAFAELVARVEAKGSPEDTRRG